ncbi:hypothetical protein ONZ51_g4863 [Trametes cubensis]|uniref:Uncharacterized protein n=1 Tax=Trametes cubensis TaxID=1111947 RepID=A0AAD7TV84_9APHY|nr:hypothetical protein ONZ51_g4863 [Trametes cubensis]
MLVYQHFRNIEAHLSSQLHDRMSLCTHSGRRPSDGCHLAHYIQDGPPDPADRSLAFFRSHSVQRRKLLISLTLCCKHWNIVPALQLYTDGLFPISYVTIFTEPLTSILVSRFLLNLQEVHRDLGHGATDATSGSDTINGGTMHFARVIGSLGSSLAAGSRPSSEPETISLTDAWDTAVKVLTLLCLLITDIWSFLMQQRPIATDEPVTYGRGADVPVTPDNPVEIWL